MPQSKLKSIFDRNWQYEISRNLPVWHSEMNCHYKILSRGYKYFGLPSFLRLRTHHGVHCDFYHTDNGPHNHALHVKALLRRYGQSTFLYSLRPKYKKLLSHILSLAKNLKPTTPSLKEFFAYYGWAIPTLDITAVGSKVVSDHLEELLKNNPEKQQIIAYYGRQRGLAPIQKLSREIAELQGKKFDLTKEASKLYKKYFWIPANFVSDVWTLEDFKEKIKNLVPEPTERLTRPQQKISPNIKYWTNCLGEIAYLNEFRKSYFTRINVIIRPVLQQIAKKNNLGGWPEINLLNVDEILDLARGRNDYQKKIIKEREKRPFAFYSIDEKRVGFLNSKETEVFEKRFKLVSKNIKEMKGVIASSGLVRGRVRVILTPADFNKLKFGDILVAKMTSTDFIPIMKRAGAIVTDEGGLACHAAIISREMNKPCIIGTKIATKAFKDGDLVEVDAKKGIVKKL